MNPRKKEERECSPFGTISRFLLSEPPNWIGLRGDDDEVALGKGQLVGPVDRRPVEQGSGLDHLRDLLRDRVKRHLNKNDIVRKLSF